VPEDTEILDSLTYVVINNPRFESMCLSVEQLRIRRLSQWGVGAKKGLDGRSVLGKHIGGLGSSTVIVALPIRGLGAKQL
jgi:hypothetical protein